MCFSFLCVCCCVDCQIFIKDLAVNANITVSDHQKMRAASFASESLDHESDERLCRDLSPISFPNKVISQNMVISPLSKNMMSTPEGIPVAKGNNHVPLVQAGLSTYLPMPPFLLLQTCWFHYASTFQEKQLYGRFTYHLLFGLSSLLLAVTMASAPLSSVLSSRCWSGRIMNSFRWHLALVFWVSVTMVVLQWIIYPSLETSFFALTRNIFIMECLYRCGMAPGEDGEQVKSVGGWVEVEKEESQDAHSSNLWSPICTPTAAAISPSPFSSLLKRLWRNKFRLYKTLLKSFMGYTIVLEIVYIYTGLHLEGRHNASRQTGMYRGDFV